ncbi:MAG: hypothetical protein KAY24_11735, partial [Candidatus Eisenbacteria sp.]|nr:hypothetical protein [Candidatus Eisenbacteria bacterium]
MTGAGGTVFHFAPGFNMNYFPSGVPQLTIGSLMGTEGMLRYAESDLGDNVGHLKLFGLGARHNVGQYFSNLPVDLSAGVWWQSFTLGDLIDASAFYVGGQASYTTSMLTFYGGMGLENASLEISYLQATNETGTEKVTFDMTSDNSLRLTAGAALSLAVFHLHADYNL